MQRLKKLVRDTSGDAVVEATILFPIIIMIFTGLVLLAMYLPNRAVLQHATQYAATAIATEQSDTWLEFDEESMGFRWMKKSELPNVYTALFSGIVGGRGGDSAEKIVTSIDGDSVVAKSGTLEVSCTSRNYIVYKEIVVTATRTVKSPVNLSFVGFPQDIPITVTSTAVVQNGDEFVRNMDIVADVVEALDKNQTLSKLGEKLGKVWEYLGVK